MFTPPIQTALTWPSRFLARVSPKGEPLMPWLKRSPHGRDPLPQWLKHQSPREGRCRSGCNVPVLCSVTGAKLYVFVGQWRKVVLLQDWMTSQASPVLDALCARPGGVIAAWQGVMLLRPLAVLRPIMIDRAEQRRCPTGRRPRQRWHLRTVHDTAAPPQLRPSGMVVSRARDNAEKRHRTNTYECRVSD